MSIAFFSSICFMYLILLLYSLIAKSVLKLGGKFFTPALPHFKALINSSFPLAYTANKSAKHKNT